MKAHEGEKGGTEKSQGEERGRFGLSPLVRIGRRNTINLNEGENKAQAGECLGPSNNTVLPV